MRAPPSGSSQTTLPAYSSAIQRAARSTSSVQVGASSRTRRGECTRGPTTPTFDIDASENVRGPSACVHHPRSSQPVELASSDHGSTTRCEDRPWADT
jgi:hypothetical protein